MVQCRLIVSDRAQTSNLQICVAGNVPTIPEIIEKVFPLKVGELAGRTRELNVAKADCAAYRYLTQSERIGYIVGKR